MRRASGREEGDARVGYQGASRHRGASTQGERSSLVQAAEPTRAKESIHAGRWPGAGCGSSRVRRKDSPAKRTELRLG